MGGSASGDTPRRHSRPARGSTSCGAILASGIGYSRAYGGWKMAETRHEGGVSYHIPGKDYFEQRELRRHAGVFALWALGVGAVISGDFSGWNLGFAV